MIYYFTPGKRWPQGVQVLGRTSKLTPKGVAAQLLPPLLVLTYAYFARGLLNS